MYVYAYACSYTFFFLAMPTTDYCVDQICGHMLVRGFTYLPFFAVVVHSHHNHDGLCYRQKGTSWVEAILNSKKFNAIAPIHC